ncbi:polysaccharide deacetylase family protein [Candidatus Kuenenbacteria bacterium]|nr:polysaccharide deacetylase family protein [Candidatus Kuenenbacteria bacterium]
MFWLNLLHIYQPPEQKKEIIKKITIQSYSKILNILKKRPEEKITLNINGSLTEQFDKYGFKNIINNIKKLAENGQIELVGSAKYHLILPLVPEQEIIRQIKLNYQTNKKYFGKIYQPKGFFIPELAYSKKVARILKKLGYQWIVLDEMAYNVGAIGQSPKNSFYQIKGLNNFYVFFRNRTISNLFFTPHHKNATRVRNQILRSSEARNISIPQVLTRGEGFTGEIKNSKDFFKILNKTDLPNNTLITALDGENLGHHQLKMAEIWQEILDSKKLQTITFSEYFDRELNLKNIKIIEPQECSWASKESELKKGIPFFLWNNPNNKIHQLQWKFSRLAIKIVTQANKNKNIRKELDQALFSCQYWWANYGLHWSPGMIQKGAEKLLKVIRLAHEAKFINLDSLQKAQNFYNKIILTTEEQKN